MVRKFLLAVFVIITVSACQPKNVQADILSDSENLGQVTWLWVGSYLNQTQSFEPEHPDKFTIVFDVEQRYRFQADCNVGSGRYQLDGANISLGNAVITRAFCGPQSHDSTFLAQVKEVESWEFVENQLKLRLKDKAGYMLFSADN